MVWEARAEVVDVSDIFGTTCFEMSSRQPTPLPARCYRPISVPITTPTLRLLPFAPDDASPKVLAKQRF